ncbi:MAG: tetratricopeptide repeat protein [Bacteroidia bacterium]
MKRKIFALILLMSNFFAVFACMWDYDTIEMERQQFPGVIELISGKFLRHSPEFHYWRIKDREAKLKIFPDSLALYDDLSVSYSKIGNDKKAIGIMLNKDSIKSGIYETYANLGTFYLHDGSYETGIRYIDRAIEINPNAHFGREIYQRYLAEYVLSKMHDGKIPMPLNSTFTHGGPDYWMYFPPSEWGNFYSFLLNKYKLDFDSAARSKIDHLPEDELDKALSGVMGMMKFGNYNSPILLEALGDLLLNAAYISGARQLAARAYFKASYAVEDTSAKEIYNKRIAFILFHQYTQKKGNRFTLYQLEELLKEEMEDGDNFYLQIRNDEIGWINSGKNPEKEFNLKYYQMPEISVRIQHGSGEDTDGKYIWRTATGYYWDTTIGKNVEYRNILNPQVLMDSNQLKVIDSLFDVPSLSGENGKEKNSTGYKWFYSIIAFILSVFILSGLRFWRRRSSD